MYLSRDGKIKNSVESKATSLRYHSTTKYFVDIHLLTVNPANTSLGRAYHTKYATTLSLGSPNNKLPGNVPTLVQIFTLFHTRIDT